MEKLTVNKWELAAVFVILMVSGMFLYSNPEDPSFEETLAGKMSSVAILSDSSMVVTGNFAEGYAFKVTPERQIDWDFMKDNEAGGFNGVPKVVKRLDGDAMLFGGNFTNYDQSVVGYFVKVGSDGQVDMEFARNSGVGFNDVVYDIVLLQSGSYLVVGAFDSYNGESVPGIARINPDGTLDGTFKGVDISGVVKTAKENKNTGHLYVGGDFVVNGSDVQYFAKLKENGKLVK